MRGGLGTWLCAFADRQKWGAAVRVKRSTSEGRGIGRRRSGKAQSKCGIPKKEKGGKEDPQSHASTFCVPVQSVSRPFQNGARARAPANPALRHPISGSGQHPKSRSSTKNGIQGRGDAGAGVLGLRPLAANSSSRCSWILYFLSMAHDDQLAGK